MEIKDYVKERKNELKREFLKFERMPNITIVQLNDDPASNAYVKGKINDALELGVDANLMKLSSQTSEEDLLDLIDSLNEDEKVDGFIVQLPLPQKINTQKIKSAISVKKDIDGFHPLSSLIPCTPLGILNYLKSINFVFKGKNAVVIGRSEIVGRPMAKLLLRNDMNVTVLHSKTSKQDMNFYLSHADLIISAVGKIGLLNNDYDYNKNAILVDVGISRSLTDNKLHGDALPNLKVALQTPVPGGVGLLTRLALYENVLKIASENIKRK